MNKYYAIFILVICSLNGFTQGRFFIRAGGGIIYYNGDLNDRILTHQKLIKPTLTVAAGYYFLSRASIGLQYYRGKLLGNDAYAIGNDNKIRNLNFQSKINELSLILEASLFPLKSKWIVNPFIGGGIGVFTFSPEGEREGQLVKLQPLGTEGQFIPNSGNPAPYKLTQILAPAFLGFYVNVIKSLRVRFEISNHFTFTDYLDDVSKNYPDSAGLAATPNGANAVLFSSMRTDGKFPKAGNNRGNNLAKDSYTTVTISIVYNPSFGKKKKKNALGKCFGFKKY